MLSWECSLSMTKPKWLFFLWSSFIFFPPLKGFLGWVFIFPLPLKIQLVQLFLFQLSGFLLEVVFPFPKNTGQPHLAILKGYTFVSMTLMNCVWDSMDMCSDDMHYWSKPCWLPYCHIIFCLPYYVVKVIIHFWKEILW